jgi:hypothetical protein
MIRNFQMEKHGFFCSWLNNRRTIHTWSLRGEIVLVTTSLSTNGLPSSAVHPSKHRSPRNVTDCGLWIVLSPLQSPNARTPNEDDCMVADCPNLVRNCHFRRAATIVNHPMIIQLHHERIFPAKLPIPNLDFNSAIARAGESARSHLLH